MPVLECKGLTKRFGRTTALDEVSLTVEPSSEDHRGGKQSRNRT